MMQRIALPAQARIGDGMARNTLLVAGGVSILLGVYHLWGGTPEVMGPVYANDLPPESAGILDVLWYHMAAVVFGGGGAMVAAAYRPAWRWSVAWLVGGQYLIISSISLVFSVVWFGNVMGLPQWVAFTPLALMMFWAARR